MLKKEFRLTQTQLKEIVGKLGGEFIPVVNAYDNALKRKSKELAAKQLRISVIEDVFRGTVHAIRDQLNKQTFFKNEITKLKDQNQAFINEKLNGFVETTDYSTQITRYMALLGKVDKNIVTIMTNQYDIKGLEIIRAANSKNLELKACIDNELEKFNAEDTGINMLLTMIEDARRRVLNLIETGATPEGITSIIGTIESTNVERIESYLMETDKSLMISEFEKLPAEQKVLLRSEQEKKIIALESELNSLNRDKKIEELEFELAKMKK